jgi:type I restriction enzyme S subunit
MTPLGQLPVDWGFHKLVEVCDQKNGLRTGPFESQLHAHEYEPEGVPVIMPKDISSGRIFDTSIARISKGRANELKQHRCITGDIIFARRGEIGRCGLVTEREEGWITGTGCLRVRPSQNKCLPSYLIQFLMLPQVTQWLTESAVGQTMLNLNSEALSSLPVAVAPMSEQLEIIAILGIWDQTIERMEKLIAAKKQLKHGLMQQLLIGRKRFDGFKNQSWRACTLGDVASESSLRNNGKLFREVLLAVTKAEGMVPMREKVQGVSVERCKVVRKGWFAYNPMRLNIGSIAKWDGPQDAMVSGDYIVFRSHEDKLDPAFLDHYRRSYRWRRFVETTGIGSVRVRIWFSDLGRIKLRLPPIDEQRRIAEVLNGCDDEISILDKQFQMLQLQKKGLMQKLLTGKVRVRV